ncbi:IPT/TIG domain-containing protein [Dinghuibacter silviterrae]|uniref:IPT/TIG domain-containing protein n=1 Tax=Dinghuibacter silviterrae TaxID=1539049 RepID=A0A4V3GLT6_9BACT|nr:IPT/TIG domain-containing protein [Dinghuibacter silviterrae]TDX00763.1 IPT/TIG domain-containing protein [Dinghuibacter silviterrae]
MKRLLYLMTGLALMLSACKKKDQSGSTPLALSSFLPTSGMGGTLVTIYGRGFGPDTLTNVVTFNGTKTSIFQVTDTSLVVIAPATGTTGPLAVNGITAGTYTYQLLSIHGASPLNGPAGTGVTITGAGFTGKTGVPVVTFNGRAATVTLANDSTLVAAVPDSAGVGPIVVSANGQTATGPVFTYQHINAIAPLTGGAGTKVTIHGVGFGTDPSQLKVDFNGTVTPVVSVTADTLIVVNAPAGVKTGPVDVTINNEKTVGPVFTEVPFPTIATVTPTSGLAGATVVITGANFSSVPTENQVLFNGTPAVVQSASGTQLTVTAPAGATSGAITLSVNQQQVTGPVFKFQVLNITWITPNNGLAGNTVIISGNGFDATTPANDKVFFNGLPATVTSAQDTQLVVTVPAGVTTGPVSVTVGPLSATGPVFYHAGVTTVYTAPSGSYVNGIAVDVSGNLYFTLSGNSSIQMIDPGGTVTTFAGSPTVTGPATDAPLSSVLFSSRIGRLGTDAQGNMYVADEGSQTIREIIKATGIVHTLMQSVGGITSMSLSPSGQLLFTEANYNGNSGVFSYNFGNNTYGQAYPGGNNFYNPNAAFTDPSGDFYVTGGNPVYEYSPAGKFMHFFGGFNNAYTLVQDPSTGNLVCGDQYNRNLTVFDLAAGTNTLLFQAGYGYQDGTLSQAEFSQMGPLAIDQQGNMYIVDGSYGGNSYIRKVQFH